jgi:putative addiction module antidote
LGLVVGIVKMGGGLWVNGRRHWCCDLTKAMPAYLDRYNACCYADVMTMQFKLTAIGNSVGVILPKEVLARLGVGKGDVLTGVAKPFGLELRTADPEFEAEMAAAEKVTQRYKNALRELAK